MTMINDSAPVGTWAQAVAREVRKSLAAREIPVSQLDGLGGKNRMYWQRRIKSPSVALDINDLSLLAARLDKPITSFFPAEPVTSD